MNRTVTRVLAALLVVAAAGCSRQLMPTPNLYVHATEDPFADVPPSRRTTSVELFYVTDRNAMTTRDGRIEYGYGRSRSAAFGSAIVEIGRSGLSWEQLVEESRTNHRSRELPLKLGTITEIGRLEPTPTPVVRVDGQVVEDPDAVKSREALAKVFWAELDRRLAETDRKEVFVLVHGYNNTFEQASFALAELWHFLGREGVPILYTWPAGSPGLLRGYTHDRESGEFSIFHLKQVFRALAVHPGIEHVNVISHSRGTDVCGSALRELLIEVRSAGKDPREVLKIKNLIIAAPDMDFEVVTQRFTAERFALGTDWLTMYVSENDKALGISDWLFSSEQRLGKLSEKDLPPVFWEMAEVFQNTSIIRAEFTSADPNRHSYFRTNPSCSSDVVLLLRYGRAPGAEHGRPLEPVGPGFWLLKEGYPERPSP